MKQHQDASEKKAPASTEQQPSPSMERTLQSQANQRGWVSQPVGNAAGLNVSERGIHCHGHGQHRDELSRVHKGHFDKPVPSLLPPPRRASESAKGSTFKTEARRRGAVVKSH